MIDWSQSHTEQEYVDAFGERKIHAKRVHDFLRPFAKVARRRGLGHNKPLQYPCKAGLALFNEAVTKWIMDSGRRKTLLFCTIVHQVALPSALSDNGLRFRKLLAHLAKKFLLQRPQVCSPHLYETMVGTEDGWRAWHQTLREHGFVKEGVLS